MKLATHVRTHFKIAKSGRVYGVREHVRRTFRPGAALRLARTDPRYRFIARELRVRGAVAYVWPDHPETIYLVSLSNVADVEDVLGHETLHQVIGSVESPGASSGIDRPFKKSGVGFGPLHAAEIHLYRKGAPSPTYFRSDPVEGEEAGLHYLLPRRFGRGHEEETR